VQCVAIYICMYIYTYIHMYIYIYIFHKYVAACALGFALFKCVCGTDDLKCVGFKVLQCVVVCCSVIHFF